MASAIRKIVVELGMSIGDVRTERVDSHFPNADSTIDVPFSLRPSLETHLKFSGLGRRIQIRLP